jgi:hypothetical protein
MKKILFGLICVMFLSFLLVNNELTALKNERDVLIKQNEELTLQVAELSNQTFSREEMFDVAAEVYRVDPIMLYAIARHETGNFKSRLFVENNNPGGIKDSNSASGWASYGSEFEGIMEMARLIRRGYYNYGLDTPEEIGAKYCPDGTDWAGAIRRLMKEGK